MGQEIFSVVALPHSKSPNADFHVSLFVSPRLVPADGEGELSEFPHFAKWASLLHDGRAEIELFDQNGEIAIDPVLSVIDPAAYEAVFPETTPVRGQEIPELRHRRWRTFPVANLHNTSLILHFSGVFLSPVSPLAPDDHPLTQPIAALGGERTPGIASQAGAGQYDEKAITSRLDPIVGEAVPGEFEEILSLQGIEKGISSIEDPIIRILAQYHRARRFYERPEAQSEYAEKPDPEATLPRPPRPDPDYHEQCVFVGDHPTVQRRLGLVVDLRVKELARLADSRWLTGRISFPESPSVVSTDTRTTCKAVGDDLVTVPSSEDWADGALRLSDTSRFSVLDTDPDSTILKSERYLLGLPRLRNAQRNGDPDHASPTALRTSGFTITRNKQAETVLGRLDRQEEVAVELTGGEPPLLNTEDVTQGYRVEVWDESTGKWYSLHELTIDARAFDGDDQVAPVAVGENEVGFIEDATVSETVDVEESPVHVHEAMFGWDGWSLSAAKPGNRVRHEDGVEHVEPQDEDPDHVTRLVVRAEVEPGTLPRLRYGRSYAFRVWATDLAGNSRPHQVGSTGTSPSDGVSTAVAAALASNGGPTRATGPVETLMRSEMAAMVMKRRLETVEEKPGDLPEHFRSSGVAGRVLHHLGEVRVDRLEPVATSDRASLVSRAFSEAILAEDQPLIVDTARLEPDLIARAIGRVRDLRGVAPAIEQISPIRPFLRWDPIPPPVVVSRRQYTEGESLRQVVVRSGVTQDPETLEVTVIPPDVYATQIDAYRSTSERHLAPPKTSQGAAEAYGAFDEAIGSADPEDHKRMYAVALREAGTLFDVEVRRLDDPHAAVPQDGVGLASDPGVPDEEKVTLPLPQGEMPPRGQYVVHDTDQLNIPYLPDVAGRRISLVFPEAGRDRQIGFPFGTEGFTARYKGTWPELLPFRLVLAGSEELHGELKSTQLTIGLPPGDVQRFRLSSAMDETDLAEFGMWRLLAPGITSNPEIIEAAKDGWMWALTPFEEVTLVHAVPRPLEAPRPTVLTSQRSKDSTEVELIGAVDVHGPSTESLTVEAHWTDPVDDLTLPRWEVRPERGVAFTTPVREEEDIALLHGGADEKRDIRGVGPVWAHEAIHKLGDTKHHMITYRFRANTRFREYFAPDLLEGEGSADPDDPSAVYDDGQSVVGPETVINVLNSAIPGAPRIHSVIPLFRWDHGTEPEQPVAVRRRRRTGVRIYLERPWYTTGRGELLGVLLAPTPALDEGLTGSVVSGWGGDPVWKGRDVAIRGELHLDNLLREGGLDDRPGDATPVAGPEVYPLPMPRRRSTDVMVLGYQPEFSEDRDMWYVDIAVDPLDTIWPFVQLAVARYQPNSLSGCHLSLPVLCDFVQLTPERTASVSRTDERRVRVVVSGPVGWRQDVRADPGASRTEMLDRLTSPNRQLIARLQKRDPNLPTDLGWETIDTVELKVKGTGRTPHEAAWVGSLKANRRLPLRRPGKSANWRVTVEEWEMLPGDPADLSTPRGRPVWERRLVYADELAL